MKKLLTLIRNYNNLTEIRKIDLMKYQYVIYDRQSNMMAILQSTNNEVNGWLVHTDCTYTKNNNHHDQYWLFFNEDEVKQFKTHTRFFFPLNNAASGYFLTRDSHDQSTVPQSILHFAQRNNFLFYLR